MQRQRGAPLGGQVLMCAGDGLFECRRDERRLPPIGVVPFPDQLSELCVAREHMLEHRPLFQPLEECRVGRMQLRDEALETRRQREAKLCAGAAATALES